MRKNIILSFLSIIFIGIILYAGIQLNLISDVYQTVLINIMINALLAVGLNLIIGVTGQFSLGHAGFMAIGAYSVAIVSRMHQNIWMGILLGIFISGVFAYLIAVLTLRLKGDYLAIATLGFSEIIRIIIQNLDITNKAAGLVLPKLFNWQIVYCLVALITLLLLCFCHSYYGRACISIREDEIASETMGVNTTKFKTLAFILGAMSAAVAGSLYAGSFYAIKPDLFSFNKSFDILVIVVFGGMGSFTGCFVAAIVIGIINTFLQSLAGLRMIIYGIVLICIMIFRPKGLMGTSELNLFKYFKKGELK